VKKLEGTSSKSTIIPILTIFRMHPELEALVPQGTATSAGIGGVGRERYRERERER
jgi:hypothetical protein